MRIMALLLTLGIALSACNPGAATESPAGCRFDVRADAAGEPTVRVFAVGFKEDVTAMRTYADYRAIIGRAVAREAPCFSITTPNLVVLPENSALMAAFIGTRAAKARQKTDTTAAFAEFFQVYRTPLAYYRAKYPDAPGIRRLLLAMTDTLGRAIETTFPVLASRYGIYLAVSVDVAEYEPTQDTKLIATLGDPDLEGAPPAYIAKSAQVYNVSIVYGPDGKEIGRVRKAYLTPPERDLLQLNYGSLEQLRPIETPFGKLAPVTSKDGWMPDVLERFNELGADITLQHEAFSGWAIEEQKGDWLPEVMMESVWSHVQAYDSFRYGVLPCITGNLLDLVFDCQSTITKESSDTDTKQAFIGMEPSEGFLDVGQWTIAEPTGTLAARRRLLRERGEAMLPGAGGPLENAYVASTARGDLVIPGVADDLRARKPAAGAPSLEGAATAEGFSKAKRIAGDGKTENAIRPDIAFSAGKHHVVWLRDKDRERSAWYAGVTGGTVSSLEELPFAGRSPYALRVAAAGQAVYAVAVQDTGTGAVGSRLLFVRSLDGGVTWYPYPTTFAERDGTARWNPAIAAAGNHVYIAWTDRRDGASDIYLAASHDQGGNFTVRRLDEPNADEDIAANPADIRNNQALPSIAADLAGNTLMVTWSDFRNYAWDIYGARSTDAAATFSANLKISPQTVEGPERIFAGSTVALNSPDWTILWGGISRREAYHSIRGFLPGSVLCFVGDCSNIGYVEGPEFSSPSSFRPHVGVDRNGHFVMVWQTRGSHDSDIVINKAEMRAPGEQFNPRTAGGAVVWEDWRGGHARIGFTEMQ